MATLWLQMTRIYGHKWISAFGDRDDGTWLRGLRGLGPEELAHGLRKCCLSGHAWPPSLPQFRALCMPVMEDFGLPGADQAYREVTDALGHWEEHQWSHPAVFHAAQEVGGWNMANLPESRSRTLFERAYEIVTRRVLEGERFSAPVPQGLPKKVSVRSSRETARRHIERIGRLLQARSRAPASSCG